MLISMSHTRRRGEKGSQTQKQVNERFDSGKGGWRGEGEAEVKREREFMERWGIT